MLGLERLGERERGVVEGAVLQRRKLCSDRGRHVLESDRADLVLDAAGGLRIPAKTEGVVDGDQHVANAGGVGDHDHASYMRGAFDDPLADPGELPTATRVDRVLARAVLARDLAGAGIHAEPLQRAFDRGRNHAKAVVGAGPRVWVSLGPGEGDRVLVEDGGTTAGEALDDVEAVVVGGVGGLRVARARDILLSERDHPARAREANGVRDLASSHPFEERAGHGGVVGGALGEGVRDELGHLELTLACGPMMAPWRRFAKEVRAVFLGSTDTHRHLRERLVVLFSVLLVVDVIGSIAIYFLERHAPMTEITTIGDSLFWTSAQLLTVSSQMHNPLTTGGRVLDIFFEFLAISVVTSLAGSFGSFFVRRSEEMKRESGPRSTADPLNPPLP
jgi:hypothetical protein